MTLAQPQLSRSSLRPATINACVGVTDFKIGPIERAAKKPEALEIHQVGQLGEKLRTFEIAGARADLFRVAEQKTVDLEFLKSSHLIIVFPEGAPRGSEWSDGRQTRTLGPSTSNTVIFNPADNYLRIRVAASKSHRCILMLDIQPSLMKWCSDLAMDFSGLQFHRRVGLADEAVGQTLVALRQELETPGVNGAFYVEVLFYLLLARLVRCASNLAEPSRPIFAKGGLPNWRLKRAIELLEADLARMPSLAEVSGAIGLHPTSFCRGFKQSMGLSPHQYMLVHRVSCAKKMMNNRRLSLTEIALDCGFGSSSQFSIVFRRITGMSPREFRRAL